MYKYLKEEGYYSDLYDLGTIEECIRIQEYCKKVKEGLQEEEKRGISLGLEICLYSVKGKRYRDRRTVIQGWKEDDRRRDEKLQNTEEPKGMRCSVCSGDMEAIFKDLYDLDGGALRVLFFFECPGCGKRKDVFDNGRHYKLLFIYFSTN